MQPKKVCVRVEPGTPLNVSMRMPENLAAELSLIQSCVDAALAERIERLVTGAASVGFAAGASARMRQADN